MRNYFDSDYGTYPVWGRHDHSCFRYRGDSDRGHRGHGGHGKRFFGRGDVKYALLQLLTVQPMHGYQMMKGLEEMSGGLYRPSPGSIYPTLQMLEDRDLVRVSEVDGKKVYAITETGTAFLQERPVERPLKSSVHDASRERFVQPEEVEKEMNDLIELMKQLQQEALHDPARRTKLHFFLRKVRGKLAGHLDLGSDK
ncbi:PadR family transcriptional regulator [Brevibacillus nitrificans]|uniref:PadR family transcriptional regulator n=1 Tax=Brevibacillus nitrificans TaxID=651560 RepID=UPI002E1C93A0|nr:PadR family transcriptional regulator [Brevibacillus nitrificans]